MVSIGRYERVDVSDAAAELLRELTAQHGPLMFHQSGGCCDGSSPMCYPIGMFITGPSDVRLGELDVARSGDELADRVAEVGHQSFPSVGRQESEARLPREDLSDCTSPRNSKWASSSRRSGSGASPILRSSTLARTASAIRDAGSQRPGVSPGYRWANSGRSRASRMAQI